MSKVLLDSCLDHCLESSVFCFSLDQLIKNTEKYEEWQVKADDLDNWFLETKKALDNCDVPSSDVGEREKQKKFLIVRISVNISGKEIVGLTIVETACLFLPANNYCRLPLIFYILKLS